MLNKLHAFNDLHGLFDEKDLLAVACSGGLDSTVMSHMLDALKRPFVLLHCNFQLRGDESMDDQEFVEQLGAELQYCQHVYCKSFETEKWAGERGLSIQEAARNLRYKFFDELYSSKRFHKLITAHHQDDNLETFFINLYRGTGLNGIGGIPPKREYIIRPLLAYTREEIKLYAAINGLKHREDSSNDENKYLRNKFRNRVIPAIQDEIADFKLRVSRQIPKLRDAGILFSHLIENQRIELGISSVIEQEVSLPLEQLETFPQSDVFLYYLLDNKGISLTQCRNILEAEPGAMIESKDCRIYREREYLRLIPEQTESNKTVSIEGPGSYAYGNSMLKISRAESWEFSEDPNSEVVDLGSISFPLELRTWKEGDRINPLGMTGNKLLSDLFVDEKIEQHEKNNIPLLCTHSEVIWAVGLRISDKIKLRKKSREIFLLEWI